MTKSKELTDKQLLSLAAKELVQLTLDFKNGDDKAFERAKYPDALKKRGLKFGVSENFIHRIMTGEFDNADGIEVTMSKVGK